MGAYAHKGTGEHYDTEGRAETNTRPSTSAPPLPPPFLSPILPPLPPIPRNDLGQLTPPHAPQLPRRSTVVPRVLELRIHDRHRRQAARRVGARSRGVDRRVVEGFCEGLEVGSGVVRVGDLFGEGRGGRVSVAGGQRGASRAAGEERTMGTRRSR